MIYTGDCVEVMRTLAESSVDAVVTDPPYALEFMGRSWDTFGRGESRSKAVATFSEDGMGKGFKALPSYLGGLNPRCKTCGKSQRGGSPCKCETPDFTNEILPRVLAFQAWCTEWGTEALRVTRPGGYLLAFGGTRTHHRLVCGLEDAGWIIRDELDWIYASGFPKGKANLKPAHEPIVLARKPGPLQALNIDQSRIEGAISGNKNPYREGEASADQRYGERGIGFQPTPGPRDGDPQGRWPSNVLLSDAELFDQPNPWVVGSGGESIGSGNRLLAGGSAGNNWGPGNDSRKPHPIERDYAGDSGGYSRFFIIPKADRADREPVLRGQLPEQPGGYANESGRRLPDRSDRPQHDRPMRANTHPTTKPTDLMRHLVRLVTPPGGTVLDCFAGSGSTLVACELEGFPWIAIEQDAGYVEIMKARLNGTQRGLGLDVPAPTKRRSIPSDEKLAELGKTYQGHATFSGGWGWEPPDEEPAV